MAPAIIIEELKKEELLFLKNKAKKDQQLLLKTLRNLSFLCFIIPTIVAILYFTNNQKTTQQLNKELSEPFTIYTYIIAVISLLSLLFLGGLITYVKSIKKIKKDLIEKSKIIEPVIILSKRFIDINNAYFFYLKSKIKYSIEVTEDVYYQYEEGDEINIEYSRFSKEYFGYF